MEDKSIDAVAEGRYKYIQILNGLPPEGIYQNIKH
jgi:hypothetical protein